MADPKEKKGFLSLAQKTIAVISASVTSLAGGQSQAAKMPAGIQNADTNIEFTYKAVRSGNPVKYIYNTADSSRVLYKHAAATDVKAGEINLKKLRPLRRA